MLLMFDLSAFSLTVLNVHIYVFESALMKFFAQFEVAVDTLTGGSLTDSFICMNIEAKQRNNSCNFCVLCRSQE